jgi:ABC-type sugar transport system ATPase subunit
MTLGDRIVVLADSRVQQVGRPIDVYRAPANRFVAGFIGTPRMNFVEGRIHREDGALAFVAEGLRLDVPREGMAAVGTAAVTLGVRPEDLLIPSPSDQRPSTVSGRVVLVERLGGVTHVHFDAGPHRLMAALPNDTAVTVGDAITLRVRTERLHLFDADGQSHL